MDNDEAKKVIRIILRCDDGCQCCVVRLLKLFNNEFPNHKDDVNLLYRETFEMEFEDALREYEEED